MESYGIPVDIKSTLHPTIHRVIKTSKITFMAILHYLLCFLILLIIKFLFHSKPKNLPPSPLALPILGHLHLLKPPIHQFLHTLSKKYGPVLFLKFGWRQVLVISSTSVVEECFTKNDRVFANRPHTLFGDHNSYNYTMVGWLPYGPEWRNLRRFTTANIFSSNSILMSSSIHQEEVRFLVHKLFIKTHAGPQKIDMNSIFYELIINVVTQKIAGRRWFGKDLDDNKSDFDHFMRIFDQSNQENLVDFFPSIRWIDFNSNKKLGRVHKRRDAFLQDFVEQCRRYKNNSFLISTGKEKNKTMMDTLLTLQEADPEQYSDTIIKGLVDTMFTAGTDTTALTMEWAMSLLLNHPEVMSKASAEINNQVQGRLLEDSDLANLPYIYYIIKETLRLYLTGALLLPHESSEECIVDGYNVPRGTMLMVNAWAIHRDPKLWLDPLKFMPQRFEHVQTEKEAFKFIPFGVGRRACPAASMAMRVMALTLGTFLQCMEWERVGKELVDMTEGKGNPMPRAIPLEAICRPNQNMIHLISNMKFEESNFDFGGDSWT